MTNRAVVILAAGASIRLGQPKAQLICGGQSLLHRAITTAARTGAAVWVTVADFVEQGQPAYEPECAAAKRMQDPCRHPTRTLVVPNASEGMSASLRVAAQTAIDAPQIDHLAVLPVDQYAVDAFWLESLFQLSAAFPSRFVASVHNGRRGAPAVFPRVRLGELLAISGDSGARHLLRAAPAESVAEWPAPWAPGDVDTIEDLAALANWARPK